MRLLDRCKQCDRTEEEHHVFDPYVVPRGCVCDPEEWRNPNRIPPVCRAFVDAKDDPGLCETCHHLKACHAVTETQTTTGGKP